MGAIQPLAMRLRAVAAYMAPFAEEAVLGFFREHEITHKWIREPGWTREEWYTVSLPSSASWRLPGS
jgi:hypothetical protein